MVHHAQDSEGELTPEALESGRLLFAGSCEFIAAANNMRVLPPEGLPEICFAGRSNVGKSSLINALTSPAGNVARRKVKMIGMNWKIFACTGSGGAGFRRI